MAIRGVDFKWYDGFFLFILATSLIIVANNWKRYHVCAYPLHIWTGVDCTAVLVFRILMSVDNGLAAGMRLDFGWQERSACFCGRVIILSVLFLLLYPFLWAWTIIGTLWFSSARECLPRESQEWSSSFLIWLLFSHWGFLIWLLFSYCGLLCIARISMGKWLTRRQEHLRRAQQGIPISEFGVLVDLIRAPDWAFEAAGQDMRGRGQEAAAYHPGLYLTPAQREAVHTLIPELPKFMLKDVPTNYSECPICLEEFLVGNEVRGLPCAHNFHVECIDEWLHLSVKCPQCRALVFPNLDLSAVSNIRPARVQSSSSVVTTTAFVRTQPPSPLSPRSFLRLQGLLLPVYAERAGPVVSDADIALETAENGGLPVAIQGSLNTEEGTIS